MEDLTIALAHWLQKLRCPMRNLGELLVANLPPRLSLKTRRDDFVARSLRLDCLLVLLDLPIQLPLRLRPRSDLGDE